MRLKEEYNDGRRRVGITRKKRGDRERIERKGERKGGMGKERKMEREGDDKGENEEGGGKQEKGREEV